MMNSWVNQCKCFTRVSFTRVDDTCLVSAAKQWAQIFCSAYEARNFEGCNVQCRDTECKEQKSRREYWGMLQGPHHWAIHILCVLLKCSKQISAELQPALVALIAWEFQAEATRNRVLVETHKDGVPCMWRPAQSRLVSLCTHFLQLRWKVTC